KPTQVNSLAEYEEVFGFAENTVFCTMGAKGLRINKKEDQFLIDGAIEDPFAALTFRLYYSLQLYYLNGGGPCYITSCGQAGAAVNPALPDFERAFEALQ